MDIDLAKAQNISWPKDDAGQNQTHFNKINSLSVISVKFFPNY